MNNFINKLLFIASWLFVVAAPVVHAQDESLETVTVPYTITNADGSKTERTLTFVKNGELQIRIPIRDIQLYEDANSISVELGTPSGGVTLSGDDKKTIVTLLRNKSNKANKPPTYDNEITPLSAEVGQAIPGKLWDKDTFSDPDGDELTITVNKDTLPKDLRGGDAIIGVATQEAGLFNIEITVSDGKNDLPVKVPLTICQNNARYVEVGKCECREGLSDVDGQCISLPATVSLKEVTISKKENEDGSGAKYRFPVVFEGFERLNEGDNAFLKYKVQGKGITKEDFKRGLEGEYLVTSSDRGERVLSLEVQDDSEIDPDETFTVVFTGIERGAGDIKIKEDGVAKGVILNDDEPVVVNLATAETSKKEGNEGDKTVFTFTVNLDRPIKRPAEILVSMDFGNNDNLENPADRKDFEGKIYSDTPITIPAGKTSATFDVTVKGDDVVEPDEEHNVYIFDAYFYKDDNEQNEVDIKYGSSKDITITIENDDCEVGFAMGDDGKCTNIDDCTPNQCLNNAICTDADNGFTCSCTVGFSGETCGEAIQPTVGSLEAASSEIESEAGTNLRTEGWKSASGSLSYEWSASCDGGLGSGSFSDDKSEAADICADVPCLNGGTCSDMDGSCTCAFGFSGTNCEIMQSGTPVNNEPKTVSPVSKTWTAPKNTTDKPLTCTITVKGTETSNKQSAFETTEIKVKAKPVTVSISAKDANKEESNDGTTGFTYTVKLDNAASEAFDVNWKVGDDSKTNKDDFAADTGKLSFAKGDQSKDLVVQVKGDKAWEGNEEFTVAIDETTLPKGIKLGANSTAKGTIKNDDYPTISIVGPGDSVNEGNSDSELVIFAVYVQDNGNEISSDKVISAVTIDWKILLESENATDKNDFTDDTKLSGTYKVDKDTASYNYLDFKVKGDEIWESDETVTIEVTHSIIESGQTKELGKTRSSVTIKNDDAKDYCADDPCKNNGQCSNDLEKKTFSCACTTEYKGTTCDQLINNPPVVKKKIEDQIKTVGDWVYLQFNYTDYFSDADGDGLALEITGYPESLSFTYPTPGGGSMISGTLKDKDVREHTITVTAKDGKGGKESTTFKLTVKAKDNSSIINATCPVVTPFRCPDNTCKATHSDCTRTSSATGCPKITCPDGSCVEYIASCPKASTSTASSKKTTDFKVVNKTVSVSQTIDEKEDSDGNKSLTFTIELSCPTDKPVECSANTCAPTQAECTTTGTTCSGTTPVQCADGSCAVNQTSCPTVGTTCAAPTPFRCPDNTCKATQSDCPAETSSACATGQVLCKDGSCASSPNQCPTVGTTCAAPTSIRCPDNRCKATQAECTTTGTTCSGTTPVQCADGSCAVNQTSCPTVGTTCAAPTPLRCPDNTCKATQSECTRTSSATGCPATAPITCNDGSCRPTLGECPR